MKKRKYLKGVYDYEQRKQEKIENMRKQKQEKELKKVTYYPKINKESNLKFKVNLLLKQLEGNNENNKEDNNEDNDDEDEDIQKYLKSLENK